LSIADTQYLSLLTYFNTVKGRCTLWGNLLSLERRYSRSTEAAVELLGHERPFRSQVELRGKITRDVIEEISRIKKEPEWMTRLKA
jgi:hypothetical protein